MNNKTHLLTAYLSGAIFALGLALAGMYNPAKVKAFLDVTGAWDPSLGLVMGAALAIGIPGFALISKRSKPLFSDKFDLLARNHMVDWQLVLGAVLFGLGWGLLGLCPAPALFSVFAWQTPVLVFFAAMICGMIIVRLWQKSRAK